jgi:hypothetical protein
VTAQTPHSAALITTYTTTWALKSRRFFKLFEAVLGHSRARGPGRLLVAAMAAVADVDGFVSGPFSEELCRLAGVADRTYRRARAELLASG